MLLQSQPHHNLAPKALGQISDRINVRLNAAGQAQIQELLTLSGESLSDIVRQSIEVFHAQQMALHKRKQVSAMVKQAGKYRSTVESAGNLSSNYKTLLAEGLKAKHR